MAKVLIAWELGEAFGHLARCLQLALAFRRRGHKVVLALKDVRLPTARGLPADIQVLAAPMTPHLQGQGRPPSVNYADVLLHSGFSSSQDVAARLVAWQGIISLARPDVVIGDHAPTALLAARMENVPSMAIGNGFAIPPEAIPWPSIRPWEQISGQALLAAEESLDRVTAEAQKTFGVEVPVRVRELFEADSVLDTFAELDHYGPRPGARYIGPINAVPSARPVSWQDATGAKVLAYLRPEVPGCMTILQALAGLDAEVLCVVPGLRPDVARRMATARLRISLGPVALPPLFEQASLAVGYGNSGFSTQALLAGVPLLMRPRFVEQALMALRVEAFGAGAVIEAHAGVETVTASLQAMLHSQNQREAARAFRDRYRQFVPGQASAQVVALAEEKLLGGSRLNQHEQALAAVGEVPTCLH